MGVGVKSPFLKKEKNNLQLYNVNDPCKSYISKEYFCFLHKVQNQFLYHAQFQMSVIQIKINFHISCYNHSKYFPKINKDPM